MLKLGREQQRIQAPAPLRCQGGSVGGEVRAPVPVDGDLQMLAGGTPRTLVSRQHMQAQH